MFAHSLATLLSLPLLFASTTIQSNICSQAVTPTITSPTNGQTTTSATLLASGTTTKNSTVAIGVNGQQQASVTADNSGAFQVQVTLTNGTNQLTFQASNACGTSGVATVTVVATLPVVTSPTSGGTTPVNPSTNTGTPSTTGNSDTSAARQPKAQTGSIASNAGSTDAASTPPSSNPVTSTSSNGRLQLTVASPANHSSTRAASILVSGNSTQAATYSIRVNDVIVAELGLPSTSYSVSVPLRPGNNTISITATGNDGSTTSGIVVTRTNEQVTSPEPMPWYRTPTGIAAIAVGAVTVVSLGFIVTRWLIIRKRKRYESGL